MYTLDGGDAIGEILRDADKLDALGAIGIGRAFMYGGHLGAPRWDPGAELQATYRPGATSSVIAHFYEKLERLDEEVLTAPGARSPRVDAPSSSTFWSTSIRNGAIPAVRHCAHCGHEPDRRGGARSPPVVYEAARNRAWASTPWTGWWRSVIENHAHSAIPSTAVPAPHTHSRSQPPAS